MKQKIYPLRFKPVYKDYLWGGDWIIRKYNRGEAPGIYAESWEVTDRPEGMSVVTNGPLAGKTLHELIELFGEKLLGTNVSTPGFPLLIKLIDSKQCLSVQVHPSDETAVEFGGEAKTEMWYALDAQPGAQVYAGLNPSVTPTQFKQAIEDHSFGDVLKTAPMKKGDAIFIPGGRVHAIDAGCLLLEVQQNSNTTYRIYDWGRVGVDGQPRDLHIEKAMEVIMWDDQNEAKLPAVEMKDGGGGNRFGVVCRSPYFVLSRMVLSKMLKIPETPETFQFFFVAEGAVRLKWGENMEEFTAGTGFLVPAAMRDSVVNPVGDAAELLRITVP